MYAKVDEFEIPLSVIRYVLPTIDGLRIVGDAFGGKDYDVVKDGLSSMQEGNTVNVQAISNNGERIDGRYIIERIKLEERGVTLSKARLTFHIVLKRVVRESL